MSDVCRAVGAVAGGTVLEDVEALGLFLLGDPQSDGAAQQGEHGAGGDQDPDHDDDHEDPNN